MGVERGGPRRREFVLGQQLHELGVLLVPILIVRVEDLREAAPTDETHQRGFLLSGGRALLLLDGAQRFDRREIVAEFVFGTAFSQPVGVADAVVVLVAERLLARNLEVDL